MWWRMFVAIPEGGELADGVNLNHKDIALNLPMDHKPPTWMLQQQVLVQCHLSVLAKPVMW